MRRNTYNTIIICFVGFCLICSCKNESVTISKPLIPYPDKIELIEEWSKISQIMINDADSLHKILFQSLDNFSFCSIEVVSSPKSNLHISTSKDLEEAYSIEIKRDKILISISKKEGIFWAAQMISQLLHFNNGKLPMGRISAKPKFAYRGMHLDVCRHMFKVSEVKRYIDFLFFYGYNKFHWHLTEDQGWRIEIKKYPKLQEVAAYRDETLIGHYNDSPQQFDGNRYGGFYTQEEVKHIVDYANKKGIEIIPEIELPGHSLAALSAYPELACENKEYKVATKWGVFHDIYCPTEQTFEFLENVLDEVIELFPSKYIHIGGDEAPKQAWRDSKFCQDLITRNNLVDEHGLQSYFIKRIEKYINSKGKSIIGWDEILEGGLAPNATVMSWRGIKGGIEAANSDHDVIMTPTSHCYFDYYQSNNALEPLAIGGYLPLNKVYNYDPIPQGLAEEKHKFIIGAQGNVWTEYIPSFSQVEYMALARMAALAEVLWKEVKTKDFQLFEANLSQHTEYWQSQEVNIADLRLDISPKVLTNFGVGAYLDIGQLPENSELQYTGPNQNEWTTDISEPFMFTQNGKYVFRAIQNGKTGRPVSMVFKNHLGTKASLLIKNPPAEQYGGLGSASLINGILGPDTKYGGTEWLGFEGLDFDAELIFKEEQEITSINLRFFNGPGQWIYLPKTVEVFSSLDGKSFETLIKENNIQSDGKVAMVNIKLKEVKTKYLKILAKNYGRIPSGEQGEGNHAWLFVDEVVIE